MMFHRLCHGVERIQQASCAQLRDRKFIRSVVERVGLVHCNSAANDREVYGEAARFAINTVVRVRREGGLWQDPQQFADALIHLGTHLRVQTYIEYGTRTGWTTAIISAFLQRVGGLSSGFTGYGVDIITRHIANATFGIFRHLGVQYVDRPLVKPRLLSGAPQAKFDLCFIDASHNYADVARDYDELGPWCKSVMLHDIADSSSVISDHMGSEGTEATILEQPLGGGVPLFWTHLAKVTSASRRTEFVTSLNTTANSRWGIGILAPGPMGNAESDDPKREWINWRGATLKEIFQHMCFNNQVTGREHWTRLCKYRDSPQGFITALDLFRKRANRKSKAFDLFTKSANKKSGALLRKRVVKRAPR
jgi:hypothetical protein